MFSMSAQVPDIIVYRGEEHKLFSNPLELYWRGKRRPAFHGTSVCHRGYVAYWEINDDYLYLTSINGQVKEWSLLGASKVMPVALQNFFPKSVLNRVKAVWFTGKLRIPTGNMLLFADQGYDSRFEEEQILTIENGHVVKTVTLNNTAQRLTVE